MGNHKGSFDHVDGVAEAWLWELWMGAAVDGLAQLGDCTVREDISAMAGKHYVASDQCSYGVMCRYAGSFIEREDLLRI